MRWRQGPAVLLAATVLVAGAGQWSAPVSAVQTYEDPPEAAAVGPVRNAELRESGGRLIVLWDPPADQPDVRDGSLCLSGGSWCLPGRSGMSVDWSEVPGAGATVLFRLIPVVSTGELVIGVLLSAQRPAEPLSPALNLRATSDATSIDLSWDPPLGAVVDGYRVGWGLGEQVVTGPSARISGLAPATRYGVRVTAFNAAQRAEPAEISVTTTLDPVPQPSAPGPVRSARVTGVTARSLTVDWEAPSGSDRTPVESYRVEVPGRSPVSVPTTQAIIEGLSPNREYVVGISAVNQMGGSPAVQVRGVTATTVPDAPAALAIRSGDQLRDVVLRWEAPASDGGSPVLRYDVSWGDESRSTSSSTMTVRVVEAGRQYTFAVRAVNALGSSRPTTVEFVVPIDPVPRPDVPSPPQDVAVVSTTSSSVALRWRPPVRDGGSEVTGYRVLVPGQPAIETSKTQATVTDLRPNRSYTFTLLSLNQLGESAPAFVTAVTDIAPPSPPQALVAVPRASSDQMALSWLPPADTGGSPVTGYTVWWGTGEMSVTAPEALVMSLRPGTRYTFQVTARNQAGSSLPAEVIKTTPFDPVPRPQAPSVPREVQVTGATPTSLAVDWREPASPGGSDVTYRVDVDGGAPVEVAETTYLVTGLAPNREVAVTVRAVNQLGSSDPVTVRGVTTMTTPDAPTNLRVQPAGGLRDLRLSWDAPARDGGSPIRRYELGWSDGVAVTGDTSAELTVPRAGAAYTFTVRAVNDQGSSAPAALRHVVPLDPAPRPDAPSVPRDLEVASTTSSSVALRWRAPSSDGGSPVTGYRVLVPGQSAIETESTSTTVAGLAPNREYAFAVVARNQLGESVPVVVSARTAIARPSAPRDVEAVSQGGFAQMRVTWRPPQDLGGGSLLGYRVSWGADEAFVTAPNLLVTGLQPATRYRFTVVAVNEAGNSPDASTTRTTPLDPQGRPRQPEPQDVRVTGTTPTTIALSWRSPDPEDGPPVTGYRIVDGAGREYVVESTAVLVRGLSPSTTYPMAVYSIGPMGQSHPVAISARTSDDRPEPPTPDPIPGPPPAPQPFTPSPVPGVTEADLDLDGQSRTLRQTAPGKWPAARVVRAGRTVVIERLSGFRTNAGQIASLSVTKKSPSIQRVVLRRDVKKRVYTMTVYLRSGRVSGRVILTVSAPAVSVASKDFESLQSSKQFIVRR